MVTILPARCGYDTSTGEPGMDDKEKRAPLPDDAQPAPTETETTELQAKRKAERAIAQEKLSMQEGRMGEAQTRGATTAGSPPPSRVPATGDHRAVESTEITGHRRLPPKPQVGGAPYGEDSETPDEERDNAA